MFISRNHHTALTRAAEKDLHTGNSSVWNLLFPPRCPPSQFDLRREPNPPYHAPY